LLLTTLPNQRVGFSPSREPRYRQTRANIWLGLLLLSLGILIVGILLSLLFEPKMARRCSGGAFWNCVMCRLLTIVRQPEDRDTYLVLDSLGEIGLGWRETNEADTERGALVKDLLDGQYEDPVRIVVFNVAEGWSRDVTEDVADELRERCADLDETPVYLEDFLERHPGSKA